MANGAHAALPALLDVPPTTNDQRIELGEAMASAMSLFAWGIEGFKDDKVPPALKTAGGQRLARLYRLRQTFNGDFDAVAAAAGKRALRQQVELEFEGIELPDSLLDMLADGVLSAVRHIEAALAH
jgi:hypothetical protein